MVAQVRMASKSGGHDKMNGFTVKSHFEGQAPGRRQIYAQLLKKARRFGPVIEDPKKTSIHLVNRTAFAGVATRKTAIGLTLKSDLKLESPRIHKSEQVSAKRFRHEIRLTQPKEVDAELTTWLKRP